MRCLLLLLWRRTMRNYALRMSFGLVGTRLEPGTCVPGRTKGAPQTLRGGGGAETDDYKKKNEAIALSHTPTSYRKKCDKKWLQGWNVLSHRYNHAPAKKTSSRGIPLDGHVTYWEWQGGGEGRARGRRPSLASGLAGPAAHTLGPTPAWTDRSIAAKWRFPRIICDRRLGRV